MTFSTSVFLFGLVLIGVSICVWKILPKKEQLWHTIPRERYVGTALAAICLTWSAMNAYPLLEGGAAKFRSFLAPLAITITVLSYFLLDYLFSRALGGVLLLLVSWLLHEAFVVNIPFRPLFSTICYLFGIASFFLIAAPYRLRDLLEKITHEERWRTVSSILIGTIGCLLVLISASKYVL